MPLLFFVLHLYWCVLRAVLPMVSQVYIQDAPANKGCRTKYGLCRKLVFSMMHHVGPIATMQNNVLHLMKYVYIIIKSTKRNNTIRFGYFLVLFGTGKWFPGGGALTHPHEILCLPVGPTRPDAPHAKMGCQLLPPPQQGKLYRQR